MNISLNDKLNYLAETYGRDAFKAVNECPFEYIAWYECGGGGKVKEKIADDELNLEYFNDLVDHCNEDVVSDFEFWDNLSSCLSGFIIDGNPYKEDEGEF